MDADLHYYAIGAETLVVERFQLAADLVAVAIDNACWTSLQGWHGDAGLSRQVREAGRPISLDQAVELHGGPLPPWRAYARLDLRQAPVLDLGTGPGTLHRLLLTGTPIRRFEGLRQVGPVWAFDTDDASADLFAAVIGELRGLGLIPVTIERLR